MPSNGALFVGYVMILAFVSSPLELIRIPELVIYVYNRLTAVTRLEREKGLHKVIKSQKNVNLSYILYCGKSSRGSIISDRHSAIFCWFSFHGCTQVCLYVYIIQACFFSTKITKIRSSEVFHYNCYPMRMHRGKIIGSVVVVVVDTKIVKSRHLNKLSTKQNCQFCQKAGFSVHRIEWHYLQVPVSQIVYYC